jgi:hypothetical protein
MAVTTAAIFWPQSLSLDSEQQKSDVARQVVDRASQRLVNYYDCCFR